MDWVKALSGYSRSQISSACDAYLRDGKWRPTPGDIRGIIAKQRGRGGNRMANLTQDEARRVATILGTARRHVSSYPAGSALHEAGKATIAYWESGE